jgi:alpha-ribazole phosphatase
MLHGIASRFLEQCTMLVFRHPEVLHAKGLCYGRLDLEATAAPLGDWADAAQAAALLCVYSSPLRRCKLPALELSRSLGLPLQIDERLAEFDFGSWEGLAWDAVPRAELDAWAADFTHYRPGGAQSLAEFFAQVHAWLAQAEPRSAVITHQGVANVLAWRARGERGLPRSHQWPVRKLGFGEWFLI